MRLRGGSSLSILSSFLMRDWTCAALAACFSKRSMKRSSFLSIACCRVNAACVCASRTARSRSQKIVVARIADELAAVDVDDARDDAIHEVAVVASHQHG